MDKVKNNKVQRGISLNLIYKTSIDCAHKIPDTPELITKKCAEPHGHTYNFEFLIALEELKKSFNVSFVDFALLKEQVEKVLIIYDHHNLGDWKINTVEDLLGHIHNELSNNMKIPSTSLHIKIFETAKYGVEC